MPVGFQVAFAFFTRTLYKGVLWKTVPTFSLGNFVRAFTESTYSTSLAWTVGVALLTAAVGITLAMPVAYFLARYKPLAEA